MREAHLAAAVLVYFLGSRSRTLSFAFAPSKCRSKTISTSQLCASSGLYRPFCEHALSRLVESGLFEPSTDIPTHLQRNEAPAKGMPPGTLVKIETRALLPRSNNVAYARCALLETILPNEHFSTCGIQVMNLVVFPSPHTNLPVWGVDLVSLPGDKHLLAMDVQPMTKHETYHDLAFQDWHEMYVKNTLEWGGDIPEQAQKFFSPNLLWTRLKGEEALPIIQEHVRDAFVAHLELYLQLVEEYSTDDTLKDNCQEEYLQYRLTNDPARPMLQSLYGAEWTEQLLTQVLFPKQH